MRAQASMIVIWSPWWIAQLVSLWIIMIQVRVVLRAAAVSQAVVVALETSARKKRMMGAWMTGRLLQMLCMQMTISTNQLQSLLPNLKLWLNLIILKYITIILEWTCPKQRAGKWYLNHVWIVERGDLMMLAVHRVCPLSPSSTVFQWNQNGIVAVELSRGRGKGSHPNLLHVLSAMRI